MQASKPYRIHLVKTKTKVDQYKILISLICLINNIDISNTDITVLSYLIHYGINDATDELIVSSGVVKHLGILRNVKTKLLKKGFLTRDDMYKTYSVNISDEIYKKLPEVFTLSIKLDNT